MVQTHSSQKAAKHNYKVSAQHVLLMLVLVVAFFILIFFKAIPFGVASFVEPLFRPNGEKLLKTGYVGFDGLCWATVAKDKEAALKGKNLDIKKEYINKETILDFTFNERTEEKNGYVKAKWEFFAKAEALGENPIYLEPWIGLTILSLVIAFLIAALITMLMPNSLGMLAVLFDRQIDNTKVKIRLQTGFSDDIVNLLIAPDDKFANEDRDKVEIAFRYIWERTVTDDPSSVVHSLRFEEVFDSNTEIVQFRNESLYERIKEYYSDFVVKEIEVTKDGLNWRGNHFWIGKGLRVYMAHHFTEKYSNNVTALAYGGAAILIVAIGVRGLKLIPAQRPSFILFAIFLEFSMLSLLAVTMFYTEEEERMDKMLKKMEDANRSQTDTLRAQQYDIHQLTNALVGQTAEIIKSRVEKSISEYMTSGDKMQNAIAEEIGSKIMAGMRDAYNSQIKHK
jgi:hypothetical protein